MQLSEEQQIAFQRYLGGENVFITGPGGSGKSELIRLIYADAISRYRNIQVTALTGCAAILLNCRAKTLHSWAGIGLGNGTVESYVLKIKKNKFLRALWREIHVLVVDEVSMLSLKLFELLHAIGKAVRLSVRPFGGIQLVFSGDFYQLPPVGADVDSQRFCFESELWPQTFPVTNQIELRKVFRQTDDVYSGILNQIREGKIKRSANDLLMRYVGRPMDPQFVAEPTKLFPTKSKVDQINVARMNALEGEERVFEVKFVKDLEMTKEEKEARRRQLFSDMDMQMELEFLANNLMCEKTMTMKIGAQVMCIVNIKSDQHGGDMLICNGSQGIVTEFCAFTGCPKVKYNNGIEMVMVRHVWPSEKIPGIGVSQVPLMLSWALTIHKSQGATLDCAEIDVGSGIFECGQTYVALSRVKSLEGLYLTSFDVQRIKIHRKVMEFYENLRSMKQAIERRQQEKAVEKEKSTDIKIIRFPF